MTEYNGQQVKTYFSEGTGFTQWQVRVTYNHSDNWKGFVQPTQADVYFQRDFVSKPGHPGNIR